MTLGTNGPRIAVRGGLCRLRPARGHGIDLAVLGWLLPLFGVGALAFSMAMATLGGG